MKLFFSYSLDIYLDLLILVWSWISLKSYCLVWLSFLAIEDGKVNDFVCFRGTAEGYCWESADYRLTTCCFKNTALLISSDDFPLDTDGILTYTSKSSWKSWLTIELTNFAIEFFAFCWAFLSYSSILTYAYNPLCFLIFYAFDKKDPLWEEVAIELLGAKSNSKFSGITISSYSFCKFI